MHNLIEDFSALVAGVSLACVRPFLHLERCFALLSTYISLFLHLFPTGHQSSYKLLRGSLSITQMPYPCLQIFIQLIASFIHLFACVHYFQPCCPSFTVYFPLPAYFLLIYIFLPCKAAFPHFTGCCAFSWAPARATLRAVEWAQTHCS